MIKDYFGGRIRMRTKYLVIRSIKNNFYLIPNLIRVKILLFWINKIQFGYKKSIIIF